ncbi:uncharacterized protein LOC131152748 [Malania oleifera]|uniref:uncharacterized protein LOC131152748 n=1 Tax=Malania oleifera TaxID=397392 RepID=UPI0025AE3176|nr:uncharacterized protein LOC131152748 [Malania oleifera]
MGTVVNSLTNKACTQKNPSIKGNGGTPCLSQIIQKIEDGLASRYIAEQGLVSINFWRRSMGIWLYDVMNISRKGLLLEKSATTRHLNDITTTINEECGDWNSDWVFYHDRGRIRVRVFDDGGWGLVIHIKRDGTQDLIQKWDIQNNYTRIHLVFGQSKIWFYPTVHPLKKDGEQHKAWVLQIEKNWNWQPCDA